MSSDQTLAAPVARRPRIAISRLIVGYGAIACALPYVALKIDWLSGGELGVADARMMHDASMFVLNAITLGMDLVGIAIAVAFTHRWGLGIPAWLVLPPMWVATGLLARFIIAVPLAAITMVLAPTSAGRGFGGPVRPWVYWVVYTEFAGLGIGLMLAFVLYARERWAFVLDPTTRARSSTRSVQVPLADAAALMAAAVASLQLAWAFGATIGLPADLVAQRTTFSHVIDAIDAAMTIAAAVGVWAIVHDMGRYLSFSRALVLAWVGGGSLFAWGLWHLINVLGNSALIRGRISMMVLPNFVALVQLIAGLVIGLVMLVALAERDAASFRSE